MSSFPQKREVVIPAKAGIQLWRGEGRTADFKQRHGWIPAFAGMTFTTMIVATFALIRRD
jgi:hypothetical protein